MKRKRSWHYKLDGHTPIPVEIDDDAEGWEEKMLEWAEWFGTGDNHKVAFTRIAPKYEVSTIFLGIDHGLAAVFQDLPIEEVPPILFETAVFLEGRIPTMKRCSTWAQAEEQHNNAVAECRAAYEKAMRG